MDDGMTHVAGPMGPPTMPAPGLPLGGPPRQTPRLDFGATLTDGWKLFAGDWLALSVGIILAVVLSIIPPLVLAPVVWAGVVRMVLRRVREDRPARIGDVFSCFDRFFTLWGLTLIVGFVMFGLVAVALSPLLLLIGPSSDPESDAFASALVGAIAMVVVLFLIMLVPMIYLETIWTYCYLLVVDETRLGATASLRESKRMVNATGFWITFALVLVVGLIAGSVGNVIGWVASVVGTAALAIDPSGVLFGLFLIVIGAVSAVPYVYQYTCVASMYFQARGERHLLPSGRARGSAGYGPPPYGSPPYGAPPYGPAPYGPPPYGASPHGKPVSPEPFSPPASDPTGASPSPRDAP